MALDQFNLLETNPNHMVDDSSTDDSLLQTYSRLSFRRQQPKVKRSHGLEGELQAQQTSDQPQNVKENQDIHHGAKTTTEAAESETENSSTMSLLPNSQSSETGSPVSKPETDAKQLQNVPHLESLHLHIHTNNHKRPSLLDKFRRKSKEKLPMEPQPTQEPLSMDLPPLVDLNLHGYKPNTKNRLLDAELACNVRNLLPGREQLFDDWYLVYSMEQHGISLRTLYQNSDPAYQREQIRRKKNNVTSSGYADNIILSMVVTSQLSRFLEKRHHGYILVVKDENNAKFGCYLNEHLRPMDQKRYYGNGECFLWKVETFDPSKLTHSNSTLDSTLETRFKAFMYTGINDNTIYSNRDFIAIGSSAGQNGLWIDKSLYTGVSCLCETFGNEILNSNPGDGTTGRFKVMGLEVWRVGDYDI